MCKGRPCCWQDSNALQRMQTSTLQLQSEVERLGVSTQQLIDDNNKKQTDIEVRGEGEGEGEGEGGGEAGRGGRERWRGWE